MSSIPQQITFDNYSYGQQQQAVLANSSVNNMTTDNFGKTQYYQVTNGPTIQTFNANQATFQNNNTSAQLVSPVQPTVVNTTTYLQTPTYSPQSLNETTTASSLMLTNAVVSTTSTNANTITAQPVSIPNTMASQQQNFIPQNMSPVEGNGMNFFPSLPVDNGLKNGQIINQNTTQATFTTITQNNEQRYPSPPMGAVDITKNQVAVATPINIVNNTSNGFVAQPIAMNQGTITQAQPTQAVTIMNSNGISVAGSSFQQQNNDFQQFYNQSFTQTIQGKGQQQTIISSTTNIASNYQTNIQNNLNGKLGQGILAVNQNVINTPMTMKTTRGKNNEPISLELALKRQKNTEAARRSRMRKVLKMETLENHVKRLEADNKNLSIRLAMLESNRIEWESKEKKLLDKIKTLEEQLAEARKGKDDTEISEDIIEKMEEEIKTE